MKRILSFVFVLVALSAAAQEYKPFKFNSSLGYAKPTGSAASGGVLFSLEPKYGLNDQLDLGLRLETAIMARAYTIDGELINGEVKAAGSYLLTGTYLLTQTNFRPYVGLGAGLFTLASTEVVIEDETSTNGTSIAGGSKFGGMIRTGFKAGHFNLGLEYNLVPSTTGVAFSSQGVVQTYQSPNSYFSVKLGIDIGGGRL
ncbi:hypothetical protein ACFSUS_02525 [Spirosoma soli]|uniref:Outer membrane protein beta-barrel domain-containing protein n=1 Tax=Spirosoma soli TaxID=1770529 RepID=A0ABW5M033_9BACT